MRRAEQADSASISQMHHLWCSVSHAIPATAFGDFSVSVKGYLIIPLTISFKLPIAHSMTLCFSFVCHALALVTVRRHHFYS